MIACQSVNFNITDWMNHIKEVVIFLSTDFKIIEFNREAEKIFHWNKTDILSSNFLHYCDSHNLHCPIPKDIDTILKHASTLQVEITFNIDSDQPILAWSITKTSIKNNNFSGYLLIAQDITQLRQTEALLQKTEVMLQQTKDFTQGINQGLANLNQFVTGQVQNNTIAPVEYAKNIYEYMENIIAKVPANIYWMNREGIYLGCNDSMAVLFKLKSRHEILGKTYEDLYDRQSGDFYRKIDNEVMTSGVIKGGVEEPLFNPDGSKAIYLSNKVPLRDKAGNIIGMLGISIDITDRKKAEQDLKEAKEQADVASAAKSEFLAVMSHEFRIPLTGILGMTKLLSMKDLTVEKRDEYIQHLSTSGSYLLNLINDILDFAKLEAGKFELVLTLVNINDLIEETCTMLTPLLKAKNLELSIQIDQNIPYQVRADKRALRQIIINLVGNAIKFTEQGYINIQVECLEKTKDIAKLVFVVSDTGIGIPANKQGMIFNHFSQVDASHSRRYGGTGLGLTVTKQLIDLMSGTIGVSSEEAKGTTFRCVIDFPLHHDESNISSPWSAYQAVRVLVVDDTPRGEVIRRHLSISNCDVVGSTEAFNTLLTSYQLRDPYKVVMISQRLMGLNSLDLGRSIRKNEEFRQSMLVLLPENGFAKTKEAASLAGFFECIVNPVRPVALQIALTASWERWIEQLEMTHQVSSTPVDLSVQAKQRHNLKVLLVEDDKIVEIIHTTYLESLVTTLDIARNGKEALEKLKNHYDLIFMDMGLPDISGKEVMSEYRKTMTTTHVPIVSLTGYGSESSKRDFIAAGAVEVLVKPIVLGQLEAVIQKYCSNQVDEF